MLPKVSTDVQHCDKRLLVRNLGSSIFYLEKKRIYSLTLNVLLGGFLVVPGRLKLKEVRGNPRGYVFRKGS